VLAGDPPIDWTQIETVEEWRAFVSDRDRHYASIVENEVLGRGRRALLLIGGMHLLRTSPIGGRFRSMPTIMPHTGDGALNEEVEAVTRDWPVPSVSLRQSAPASSFEPKFKAELQRRRKIVHSPGGSPTIQ
jgi:hypothetical protein